jgi:hypothetical protein
MTTMSLTTTLEVVKTAQISVRGLMSPRLKKDYTHSPLDTDSREGGVSTQIIFNHTEYEPLPVTSIYHCLY